MKILDRMNIIYYVRGSRRSGFGSKKMQYQLMIYNLEGIYKYYKYIGFSIKRKNNTLIKVINSYDSINLNKVKMHT